MTSLCCDSWSQDVVIDVSVWVILNLPATIFWFVFLVEDKAFWLPLILDAPKPINTWWNLGGMWYVSSTLDYTRINISHFSLHVLWQLKSTLRLKTNYSLYSSWWSIHNLNQGPLFMHVINQKIQCGFCLEQFFSLSINPFFFVSWVTD